MSRAGSHPTTAGIPIEQAPLWVLGLVALAIWLLAFPAVIGLLAGCGLWHGARLGPAIAAALLAIGLTAGLAMQKSWRRPSPGALGDDRPFFVRLSGWLLGLVLYPNLMMGLVLLFRQGPPPDYRTIVMIGFVLSIVQGILALTRRRGS